MEADLVWILGLGERELEEHPCPLWCLSQPHLSQATLRFGIIAGAPGPSPPQPGLGVPLQ